MKKVRNSVVCVVLCLTLMLGSAFSSMAWNGWKGTIRNGGPAEATYTICTDEEGNATMTAKTKKSSTILLSGKVREKNVNSNVKKYVSVYADTLKKKDQKAASVAATRPADFKNKYIKDSGNHLSVTVNGKRVIDTSI